MTEAEYKCASMIKLVLSEFHGVGILEDMQGTCALNHINRKKFVYTAVRMPIEYGLTKDLKLPLDYRQIAQQIMDLQWKKDIVYFAFAGFKLEGPYQDHEPQGPYIRFGSISRQDLRNAGIECP